MWTIIKLFPNLLKKFYYVLVVVPEVISTITNVVVAVHYLSHDKLW
jgi:hypothetical protein